MRELLIPSIKNMGVNHMNAIVNLKNIFHLIMYYYMQVVLALFLRALVITTGKCIPRYRVLSYKLFFGNMIQIV
jgi:hypothetical protein